MKAYSIYDKVANAYNKPFYCLNDGMAIRIFSEVVNDGKSEICSHPEDYSLFYVGDFSEQTGVIEVAKDCPVRVMFATELVNADRSIKNEDIDYLSAQIDKVLKLLKESLL